MVAHAEMNICAINQEFVLTGSDFIKLGRAGRDQSWLTQASMENHWSATWPRSSTRLRRWVELSASLVVTTFQTRVVTSTELVSEVLAVCLQYLANRECRHASDFIFHFLPHTSGVYRPILFISTMITFSTSTSAGPPEESPVLAKKLVFRISVSLRHIAFRRHFRHRPVTLKGHLASTSPKFLLTITFDPLLGLTSG